MGKDEANQKSVFVQLRQKLNLSQKQVAQEVGVSEQTVRNWEHGKFEPRLTIAQVKKLCVLLQMDVQELPEWFGPKEAEGGDA